jgi:hypothetical protein
MGRTTNFSIFESSPSTGIPWSNDVITEVVQLRFFDHPNA